MYKTMARLLVLSLFAIAVVSCDRDADKITIETVSGNYDGLFELSLYVPEMGIETLDSCLVENASVRADFIENATKVAFSLNNSEDISTNIPFLDQNGEVLPNYRAGVLAFLYNSLRDACAKGMVPEDVFSAFVSEIDTLKDVLTVSNISFDPVAITEVGALLITYTEDKNSPYTRFTMQPAQFTRKSNFYVAIKLLEPYLRRWYEEGLLSEDQIRILEALKEQKANTIEDGYGHGVCGYGNYYFNVEYYLEHATNLLDAISIALFGYDEDLTPAKEMWAVLRFSGLLSRVQGIEP